MNYIPGKRLIKKYIYRIILGILLVPIGPVAIIYNESRSIQGISYGLTESGSWIFWAIRVLGVLFTSTCIYLIISSVKLFMNQIPLSYREIRNGLLITSFMIGLMISLLMMAVVWIVFDPIIGLILFFAVLCILFTAVVRRRNKQHIKNIQHSVKPHQPKDV